VSTYSDSNPTIIAIDFETANYDASSACQLGLVRIENWSITHRESWFIRPPSADFVFSYIHGISWEQVKGSPHLGELWEKIEPQFKGAQYLAAHNAPFDRGVLSASCRFHGIDPPPLPFIDTVHLARKQWKIFPTKLNNVCEHLKIRLRHHEALSDAEACAEIILKAKQEGWMP
jgi:DNA polymerase-3 subunit epsilon